MGPLHQHFDLIIGTSVGSIVAAYIGLYKGEVKTLQTEFDSFIGKVFCPDSGSWFRWLVGGGFYRSEPMVRELQRYFGEKMMTDFESGPKVAFVAADVTNIEAQPYLFRNYEINLKKKETSTGYSKYPGTMDVEVWKAIRASTAGPTYFDSITIDGMPFVDGGIVANNPVQIGFAECNLLWPDEKIDLILSVGTGKASPDYNKGDLLTHGKMMVKLATNADNTAKGFKTTLNAIKFAGVDVRLNPDAAGEIPMDCTDPVKIQWAKNMTKKYIGERYCTEKLDLLHQTLRGRT